FAQCWRPFGQQRQICSEQIEITMPDRALRGLPWVVLPLVAADLPLVVWCRSERLPPMEEFAAIAGLAHKVVVDSQPMGSDALRIVSGLMRRGTLTADLSWTRLTRWREMLAQVFENRENLARLDGIREVSVHFAGQGETANWYMGAWILDAVGKAGVRPHLGVGDGAAAPVVLEGAGLRLEISRDGDRMVTSVNGLQHCTSLAQPTDYLLMEEELGILRRDPVFERTLASALQLAYASDR
ncbi:MAG TPA: glucose-6-phosphate dehydrogenase assembly protein OpcA, partial [Candidatus Sulfopaludibacter sp.]|nr:glucose-6-phosphate dehydrogenase assembly protein OpcA [Candidatus Sulfopaludibacter sp.]